VYLERLEAVRSVGDKCVAVVVHGAGGDLTVAGPVICWDGFETDGRCLTRSRRGGGVKREGVWPAGCDNIEKGGDCGALKGLKEFNKDEFLVYKEWVCGGVRTELVVDAFRW
jgi:hypothetical protein